MYLIQTYTPSEDASAKLLNGHRDGAGEVLAAMFVRAVFIAPALYMAGVREGLVRKSLAASAGVTAYGLTWLGLRLGGK